jgi:hypothetical protein
MVIAVRAVAGAMGLCVFVDAVGVQMAVALVVATILK